MTHFLLRFPILFFATLTLCSLGGCGTINSKLASGMADYVPQWAGGIPADAPPRPGTVKYDEMMKQRERERLEPAPPKDNTTTVGPARAAQSTNARAPN